MINLEAAVLCMFLRYVMWDLRIFLLSFVLWNDMQSIPSKALKNLLLSCPVNIVIIT